MTVQSVDPPPQTPSVHLFCPRCGEPASIETVMPVMFSPGVTATGFNLTATGDIAFSIDGEPLDFADTVTYRGMMFTGVPNLAWVFGYFRASLTLRVDLVADFVCRLLRHMTEIGASKVTPALRPEDHNMPLLPWIDPQNFNPGYMMRGMHLLPKRGDKPEWQHNQDFWAEKDEFPAISLGDCAFVYE
jgi:hypothetical protein